MKRICRLLAACILVPVQICLAQTVQVQFVKTSSPATYAARVIREALLDKKFIVKESAADYTIILKVSMGTPEAYSIEPSTKKITITGGDERGMVYGSLALAEELRNGTRIQNIRASAEKPNYGLRAIKFDLPWDTYRHSYALDLHISTCRDLNYWKAFLDMMVENRFNALSLWNLHPYTFMIKAKNFPEATPFNDKELKEWHQLFSGIFKMAKERCIDTYLIPFNIFVSPEFAKAHHVAMDNLEHDFFVNGDTSEIIKRYTRESVTQVLQEYPELTGFGLTLGEGMGGMTPQQREDWIKETIIEGMRRCGRKTKLVHRIPFSSTTGSLGITSIETEKLTRKAIEEEADTGFLDGPIWADLKYNWSHAHSTPRLYKVHGGKLYDTYFVPDPQKYKITWTARNEDFFCLRWGVPDFVRSHVLQNNQSYTGGYFIGSETYIPAKDYFTKIKGKVGWKYAFERQWLFYKCWGRLLYNPTTPDSIFENEFIRRYGLKAAKLLQASALAGKTPLRLASSFDFTWDFSLYSEGFMALNPATKSVEYISIDRQISQPPIDTVYISVADYVKNIVADSTFTTHRITPLQLAAMLEEDCFKAIGLVKNIDTTGNNSLMYEVADIQTWAYLGLYFAQKLKGAVALQKYRVRGRETDRIAAVKHLQNALHYWDVVVAITEPIYNDMPLTHFSEQNGNRSRIHDSLRFHWRILRPEVAKDIEIAENKK
jgi:hypothetical protein